ALKLGESVDEHAPFVFGAAAVLVGVVVLAAGRHVVAGRTPHAEVGSRAEAEAVLVGDVD
ncbi:MAG: MFS transporter, partial [Nocardioides kribbensis]